MEEFRWSGSQQPLSFCFNDTATPEIYTLSLHDALPISIAASTASSLRATIGASASQSALPACERDRKSTRLNSSHSQNSYAVFCLIKKKCVQITMRCRQNSNVNGNGTVSADAL